MFFKRILVCVLASVTVSGCSDFVNGKKAEPEVMEISDKKLACLQNVPSQLRSFVAGDAAPEDVRGSFDCLAEALRYFNKRTFSSANGAYTSEEMRNFFGKYFLKENNVTPEFSLELMKLKRALVGGSAKVVSKDEIRQLVTLIEVLRDELILLSPHMKVFVGPQSEQDFAPSLNQLRSSLLKLLESTQLAQSEYSFEDFKKAVAGLEEFVQLPQSQATFVRYSEAVPLIESLKNVFMGKKARFSLLADWQEGLTSLLDLFELYLRYQHHIRGIAFDNPQEVEQGFSFVERLLEVLADSPQMKNRGYIPREDIDVFIEKAAPLFFPTLSVESLEQTYQVILSKMLSGGDRSVGQNFVGLEKKHLVNLQREVRLWHLRQSFVNSLKFDKFSGGFTQKELAEIYKAYGQNHSIFSKESGSASDRKAYERGWQDYGEHLTQPVPVVFDSEGRLVIATDFANLKQNWASLTKANLMLALSRFLLLGYGENVSGRLSQAQLSLQGLSDWYDDFNDIGIDLKAFDKRTGNAGKRSFMEANFFTFSGNGDDQMDHRETFQFVSVLFSGGLSVAENLRQLMLTRKCGVSAVDVFGYPYFEETCFKAELKNHFAKIFANLPDLVRYVQKMNSSQWDRFYSYLMGGALVEDQRKGWVETANIRTMVMILHYVESVMVLFDKDHSQGLSLVEVKASAPRFMSFIRSVKPLKSETLLTEGFAHLVFTGTIPDLFDLGAFQIDKIRGLGEAQRVEVVRLFSTLKEQLAKRP